MQKPGPPGLIFNFKADTVVECFLPEICAIFFCNAQWVCEAQGCFINVQVAR